MKRLVFGEGLLTQALEGDKRFTVRKYREDSHDFLKDDIVIGEFKDGLDVLLQITRDTLRNPFCQLRKPKEDVATNGYWLDDQYFEELKTYYSDLHWEDTGAVIFFEVLKINGIPVVRINGNF